MKYHGKYGTPWRQLRALTLEEKASLLSGHGFWRTKAIPEKGVKSLFMADGPHGVRKEDKLHTRRNGGASVPATCFPCEGTLACSFSPYLVQCVGRAMGEEAAAQGVGLLLGPGLNMKRSPLCGRNFEYFSEDPTLAAALGQAMVQGIQAAGVGACVKHFAVNNQEEKRMSISAEVDERALREIYLRAFELVVKGAKPAAVMASYNKVNGTYACEHMQLLRHILREEWGFRGLVVSDWGAVASRPAGVAAGLDLEMPSSGGINDTEVVRAVRSGALSEKAVDEAALRVLRAAERYALPAVRRPPAPPAAHHALAVQAAAQSAVLLKNNGLLPLARGEDVAVIGALAGPAFKYQGAGSSFVNAARPESLLQALRAAGQKVRYEPGYSVQQGTGSAALAARAVHLAKRAHTVVYCMGLTDLYETEGYDRTHLRLPGNQLALLRRLAAVNPRVVVLLAAGGAVETGWMKHAGAVLYLGLAGEGAGEAARRLLYGLQAPCGRLAETWPVRLSDTPAWHHFPMGPRSVSYNESIYIGYRYYDKAGASVAFPFGYGLSYTTFAYSGLHLSAEKLARHEALEVSFRVRNTGARAGRETAQIYLSHMASCAHQPVRTLAAFAQVELAPGEEKTVRVMVPRTSFECWDAARGRFAVEAGPYEVCVGPNSRALPLRAELMVQGDTLLLPYEHSASGPYGHFRGNAFPDGAFEAILGRPLPGPNKAPARGSYGPDTTLGEMRGAPARAVWQLAFVVARCGLRFSKNPAVNRRVSLASTRDLPFKNVRLNVGAALGEGGVQALLRLLNGHTNKDKQE